MELDTARAQVATMLGADPGKHPFLDKVLHMLYCRCACSPHSSLKVAQSIISRMASQRHPKAATCALSRQDPLRILRPEGCHVHAPVSSSPLRGRARVVWLATGSLFCRRDRVHLLRHRERQLGHLGGCDGACRPCSEEQDWPAAPHCVQARGFAPPPNANSLRPILLLQQGFGGLSTPGISAHQA